MKKMKKTIGLGIMFNTFINDQKVSLYLEHFDDLIFSPTTRYTTYQAHFMGLIAVLRKIKPKPDQGNSFLLFFCFSFCS